MSPFAFWRRRRDLRRRWEQQEDERLTDYVADLQPRKGEPRKRRVFPTQRRT